MHSITLPIALDKEVLMAIVFFVRLGNHEGGILTLDGDNFPSPDLGGYPRVLAHLLPWVIPTV